MLIKKTTVYFENPLMGQTEDLNGSAWFDNKNILHESRELLDELGVEYSRC